MTWLAVGAVLGVTGYRRLARAAKSLLPHADLLAPRSRHSGGSAAARPAASRTPARDAGAGTVAFIRDVRAGMAEYLDRHRDI